VDAAALERMMSNDDESNTQWSEVLAKATAIIALRASALGDEGILVQAKFLQGLGISGTDAAKMLGIAPGALRMAKSRARKGGSRGKRKR
jgi:hypothetical protein